jgi:hypothetical protein
MGMFKKEKDSQKSAKPEKIEPDKEFVEEMKAVSADVRADRKTIRAERRKTAVASMTEPKPAETKKAPRGFTPKANTSNQSEQQAKQFEKMTYKERLNLFNSNPQSYYQLVESTKQKKGGRK